MTISPDQLYAASGLLWLLYLAQYQSYLILIYEEHENNIILSVIDRDPVYAEIHVCYGRDGD